MPQFFGTLSPSKCHTIQETTQIPPLQLQFPNLVPFPSGHTHNSGSLTLPLDRLSLGYMIILAHWVSLCGEDIAPAKQ